MSITAIRGIARRFIPEMLQLGFTTTKMLGILRGQGLGYRRTDFLRDVREMAGRERKRDPLKAIPKKLRPTAATIHPSEYIQKTWLNYNYKVTGWDVFQEKEVTEWVTVSTDVMLSMEEAQTLADDLCKRYKQEMIIEETTIDSVTSWRQ